MEQKERKINKIKTVILVIVIALCAFAFIGKLSSRPVMEKRLAEIMQDVYAPKTMEQFKEGKKKSLDILEAEVANVLFVAYSNELTEADKQRICKTYIYKGRAENQMDGRERYLVKAYLYASSDSNPIIKNFVFEVGNNGKIDRFTIEDVGGVNIDG